MQAYQRRRNRRRTVITTVVLVAIIALLAGTGVGAYTAGVIPGLPGFQKDYIGFPAVQAWIIGAVVYLVLLALAARSERPSEVLGFARLTDETGPLETQPANLPA